MKGLTLRSHEAASTGAEDDLTRVKTSTNPC